MTADRLSPRRLGLVREQLERLVEDRLVPGAAAVLAHGRETHVVATGTLAFDGAGSSTPFATDTICRLGSMSKPITAACAMTLVDDGTLRLDDPVDDLLPELADMRVLADPAGPLDDTVPAHRPITLRDLLANTAGTGMVIEDVPIAGALNALRAPSPDAWLRALGELPLVRQPGDRWLYDTASNVAGVLIARATGGTFGDAVRTRICEPLGMPDTDFTVPADRTDRFATAYEQHNAPTGEAVVEDRPDGRWSSRPALESGGGGLVSTADDYLAFASALLAGGGPVLSPTSVALMTSDQLTAEQRAVSGFRPGYFATTGWGFGMSVRTERVDPGPSVGTYGWPGFYGTAWYTDPADDLITIVMLQRAHAGDQTLPMWTGLWGAVHRPLD